ncbi:hypothetical protein PQU92_16460 [Asticcacaulis sp. BYS171W]|uniref:HEAT repeat domain-containing protein n=1 Tax=Asticcacaulis aquaticus TaxID=2984212 RepID=A0ABT5HY68_9CAUL|nr:hypothetical protein [Asticcacaulis aquaticus]MDC7684878.1 hypothetical protein [Asticcacaulis aquaticus]
MWPEDLFKYVLANLADEIITTDIENVQPMRCDRWVARSALQKAIRRGDVAIALSATANLLEHDSRAFWRHLVVVALEDLGVVSMDTVASIVAASRNKAWRTRMGGEWRVAAYLVTKMAGERHCQAVCDLLMRVLNDPVQATEMAQMLEADCPELAGVLLDEDAPIERRAAAALAMGGGLAEEQRIRQPDAVFHVLSSLTSSSHVIAIAHAAWKTSRNEMAFLLPLVWREWVGAESDIETDDGFRAGRMIDGVPTYALDQFTRIGGIAASQFVRQNPTLAKMFDAAGQRSSSHGRLVGNLTFVLDGGMVKRRVRWPLADRLRQPFRPLPGVFAVGNTLFSAIDYMTAKASEMDDLRVTTFQSYRPD